MKISFSGKIRKLTNWPESLIELKKVASRKFTERSLIDDSLNDTKQSKNAVNHRKPLIDWD